jgi:adenine-specific DNA-methyltransferase
MLAIMQEWGDYELRPLDDFERRATICGTTSQVPKVINAIVLSKPLDESAAYARKRYSEGQWPILFFTRNGRGGIACKRYLDSVYGRLVTNFWPYSEVGHTDEASKELKQIFGGKMSFDTPKPTRLLRRILEIASDSDSIILDSFAGSGTTAHAVLNINKADGGNRRFILVEMEDYAENITAERVRRVIDGYADVEGTGGSFRFYELGEPLMFDDGNLNEAIPLERIREYVWYMETKVPVQAAAAENPYYLGETGGTAYYFVYDKERVTTLDMLFLQTIQVGAERYIVYADQCTLSKDDLNRYNITFKKIPRDITKL